jgi:hypothetical protein
MPDTHTHEIVLRGRLGDRLLAPFLDDFTVVHDEAGVTRLVGTVRDPRTCTASWRTWHRSTPS